MTLTFNGIMTDYYNQINYNLLECESLKHEDRIAVIVETREHPLLRWTINNIINHTKWPVKVYHSNLNKHLLEGLEIQTVELPEYFNIEDYSRLLTSKDFWSSLPENVLIFQTDSFMLKNGIEEFMKYDYVGAPWNEENLLEQSIPVNIGNGGFSFRKRGKMLEIINQVPYEKEVEDLYFAKGFSIVGGNLPDLETQKSFSVEALMYEKPLGVHAPWKVFTDSEDLKKILYGRDIL